MLNFRYGPDGSVHVIDWYDKNQCHSSNPDVHDKTLGRIFKISHVNDRFVTGRSPQGCRLYGWSSCQLHRNDWYVRHARRILQERGPDPQVHARLKTILQTNPDVTRKLRALWALHVTGGLTEADSSACSRTTASTCGAGRSICWLKTGIPRMPRCRFASMAATDSSALVRLYIASALQRVPAEKRWDAVAGLLSRAEDRSDQNEPLMAW